MRIAIDAFGTDKSPAPEIDGVLQLLKEDSSYNIVLVGDKDEIEAELKKRNASSSYSIEIVHATEKVSMSDSPSKVLKTKPDSSLMKTITLQKEGKVDASVSAGNTGAFMAASLFGLGRIKGISRPGIGVVFPTVSGEAFLIDAGANADCKPKNIVEFGIMGSIYAELIMKKDKPTVGLINIGEEPEKGSDLTVAANELLSKEPINFIGNIEGNGMLMAKADVILSDGLIGNILLKFMESIPGFLIGALGKENINSTGFSKMKNKFDQEKYGGADLLGVNGVVTICHGSATANSIVFAIKKAALMVEQGINQKISEKINS